MAIKSKRDWETKAIGQPKLSAKALSYAQKTNTRVFVFGSRAWLDHRRYSDLDLFIETVPALSQQEKLKLREAFEESDLSIKVDIVTPETTVLKAYWPHIQAELKPMRITGLSNP